MEDNTKVKLIRAMIDVAYNYGHALEHFSDSKLKAEMEYEVVTCARLVNAIASDMVSLGESLPLSSQQRR